MIPEDIKNTALISSYIDNNFLVPRVDTLLDWRLRLKELKNEGNYPQQFYENEIKATDYLLNLSNG